MCSLKDVGYNQLLFCLGLIVKCGEYFYRINYRSLFLMLYTATKQKFKQIPSAGCYSNATLEQEQARVVDLIY
jgi:hypothetical protein